jgi:hypothetical protein
MRHVIKGRKPYDKPIAESKSDTISQTIADIIDTIHFVESRLRLSRRQTENINNLNFLLWKFHRFRPCSQKKEHALSSVCIYQLFLKMYRYYVVLRVVCQNNIELHSEHFCQQSTLRIEVT